MQRFKSQIDQSEQLTRVVACLGTVLFFCGLAGCGTAPIPITQTATTPTGPQTYFAPYVAGINGATTPLTYTFDDTLKTFSQTTYQPQTQPGPQVLNAGSLAVGQGGLRSLGITVTYTFDAGASPPAYESVTYGTPELGSFAVELADQSGGLVQMVGQPVQPLVAPTQCPNFSSAQTYQFITIPAALSYEVSPGPPLQQPQSTWNPKTDTAYGSVDIVSSGSTIKFQNIQQHTLPSVGGTGAPAQPPSSSSPVTGACGPTFFGNITTVPGTLVVTDPGQNGTVLPAQAEVGIGTSGLLVENNGNGGILAGTSPLLPYENVLGAGMGAVGLPKPSSAVDTSTVIGKQYLGFIYGAGAISPAVTGASNLVSFGSVNVPSPSSCPSLPSPSNRIYGGDFDPSTSLNGRDVVIDLGTEDTTNPGLYPKAMVSICGSYPANTTNATDTFSAVAVAGQLQGTGQTQGQYAIFLLGADNQQPWAIYLLQSSN